MKNPIANPRRTKAILPCRIPKRAHGASPCIPKLLVHSPSPLGGEREKATSGLRPNQQLRDAPSASRKRWKAFTLIEILVVISIIALLAALVVYILPAASEKKVRNRIKTELAGLETVISSYHQKRGFYPPDNTNNNAPVPTDDTARKNPLYYELTGQEPPPAVAAGVFNDLGVAGIINTGDNSENFFKTLKPSACAPLPTNPNATNLIVPYKGPNGEPNLWHYNSSRPKYNPDSYDLWADVVIGGKTITIGNWK